MRESNDKSQSYKNVTNKMMTSQSFYSAKFKSNKKRGAKGKLDGIDRVFSPFSKLFDSLTNLSQFNTLGREVITIIISMDSEYMLCLVKASDTLY